MPRSPGSCSPASVPRWAACCCCTSPALPTAPGETVRAAGGSRRSTCATTARARTPPTSTPSSGRARPSGRSRPRAWVSRSPSTARRWTCDDAPDASRTTLFAMGRTPLGEKARSVVASTRVTESEAAALRAKYGSMPAALRFGVEAALAAPAAETGQAPVVTGDQPIVWADEGTITLGDVVYVPLQQAVVLHDEDGAP